MEVGEAPCCRGIAGAAPFFADVKYGKIPEEEQDDVARWTSPPEDHADTANGLASEWDLRVRSGGTMWTIRPWRGSVYPAKAPQRTWPTHYGAAFSSIELNATHYRIHPPERMAEWADAMPSDFRFCAKFPAIISHYRRFNDCEGPTDDFIAGLAVLEEKRGPSFLQLPPQFLPATRTAFWTTSRQWPSELRLWNSGIRNGLRAALPQRKSWAGMLKLGIGAVLSDTALRRDAVHMRMTAPFPLLRFGGYEGHPPTANAWRIGACVDCPMETDGASVRRPLGAPARQRAHARDVSPFLGIGGHRIGPECPGAHADPPLTSKFAP